MLEIFQYQFMQRALIAAVLVSVACGVVGSYVVIKRIVSLSGAISHAAFGGVGIGYFLGVNPVLAAIPFSIISAIAIGGVKQISNISEDTSIGILWSVGMAIGVIFINLTPGYAPDLFSYLFGSILTVNNTDLYIMLILDIIIIATVYLFRREFLAVSFDEEFSKVVGLPALLVYMLLLALVALSVVVLIKVVGVILLIALFTIPAAISKQYTYNLRNLMILATILGIVLTTLGLILSYIFNLASGATIVMVLATAFAISYYLKG
ncbi:MAG: metal ABC transporter permease [Methanobacterium sp.]|uniref:metal ABC transporter permease n=1 Tax=Methanobacterium sp. TaxID=2164 RepID=UPI003C781FAD